MLEMITEKVTTHKRPEMIFLKAPGFVLVAYFMSIFVWDIGAEIEQLKGGQNTRDAPEEDQVFKGEYKVQQLKANRDENELPDSNVSL